MRHRLVASLSIVLGMAMTSMDFQAQAVGKITGVGGIFAKSQDPKALMAWRRDVLGVHLEIWGGAMLRYDAPSHPPAVVLNAFPAANDYMAPPPESSC